MNKIKKVKKKEEKSKYKKYRSSIIFEYFNENK